jgi:2,4-dienoyl-CoA reductase-like NADH-dependent reductase (Old Yellow Enzyme family)
VMAPMTRSRALGNVPNELMVKYYEQRASAGLIITEGTAPSANGLGYARIPGLYSQQQVDGWKKVLKVTGNPLLAQDSSTPCMTPGRASLQICPSVYISLV